MTQSLCSGYTEKIYLKKYLE